MACLTLSVIPVGHPTLAVSVVAAATVTVTPAPQPSLTTETAAQPALAVTPAENPSVAVSPEPAAQLEVGQVCSISGGTLVVLAASDGPLRTRDGGYIPLNPATNPAE